MAKLVLPAVLLLLSPPAIAQNFTVIVGATGEKLDQPYGLAIGPITRSIFARSVTIASAVSI